VSIVVSTLFQYGNLSLRTLIAITTFFERGIARALADAVDGAFDLPRAAGQAGQRIRNRHAEVVMAMDGEHRLVRVRHAFDQRPQRVYSSGTV
jgi:hypothetical protein